MDQMTFESRAGATSDAMRRSSSLVWWPLGSHRGFLSKGGPCPGRGLGKPAEEQLTARAVPFPLRRQV